MHTDDEWLEYLQSQSNGGLDPDKYTITAHSTHGRVVAKRNLELDDKRCTVDTTVHTKVDTTVDTKVDTPSLPPVFEDLYISTKTKVLYLNQEIDIHRIFWLIPVIEYWQPLEGVVKKQKNTNKNCTETIITRTILSNRLIIPMPGVLNSRTNAKSRLVSRKKTL